MTTLCCYSCYVSIVNGDLKGFLWVNDKVIYYSGQKE